MKRKGLLFLLAVALLFLLSACASQTVNPLVKNQATDVPGLSMNLHAASANTDNADQVNVTLYFRYMDEPMLAAESRSLTVKRDESVEFAIVEALTEGPSAGHSELKRLLPAGAQVESVVSRGDILFVTFNEGLLQDDVPDDWATDENWREEAPTLRRLTIQSVAASITESFPYTGIQILVYKQGELQTSLRLDNTYFLNGTTGLSEPVARDESAILTPQHTAETILAAWQQRDLERLYGLITETDKPTFATMTEAFFHLPTLSEYAVSGGSVTADGQAATLSVFLRTLKDGADSDTVNYPMLLTRENGVWKISYARLTALLAR